MDELALDALGPPESAPVSGRVITRGSGRCRVGPTTLARCAMAFVDSGLV
ncbi:MAG TPA: hypothetical protein VOA00_04675 [Thermoanaerobaculia bacterium]|nr:hypothetical protein [Thermoanaerobaculia bacterium]